MPYNRSECKKRRAHRHSFSFASNRPSSLFFPLLKIFLGSPEARVSMSFTVLAALYRLLDAFFAILRRLDAVHKLLYLLRGHPAFWNYDRLVSALLQPLNFALKSHLGHLRRHAETRGLYNNNLLTNYNIKRGS